MPQGLSPSAVNVAAFLRSSVFGALSRASLRMLAAQAVVERIESPRSLVRAGEPLEYLRWIVDGGIAVEARGPGRRAVLMSLIGPGAWASWLPCLVSKPIATEYRAMPGSVFIALPAERVRDCLADHPELYPPILAEIDGRVRLLMKWAGPAALLRGEKRMAALIGLLARDRRLGARNLVLNITQGQLAGVAGITRQSASVLLTQLERHGLVKLGYGRCAIPDLQALRRFSLS